MLSQQQIDNTKIALPGMEEQLEIVRFVDAKTRGLDQSIHLQS
jgi:hypothetical protein